MTSTILHTDTGSQESAYQVLTMSEAADFLRISEEDLLSLVNRSGIPFVKIGDSYRFYLPALHDWMMTGNSNIHQLDDPLDASPDIEDLTLDIENSTGPRKITRDSLHNDPTSGDGIVYKEDEKKRPGQIRLSQFLKRYLEYAEGVHSMKTRRTYETAFREFIRIEGDLFLGDIRIREIEHFLGVKKKESSEWTSRKYYISLRSALHKALDWGLIDENPFKRVKKPKPPEVLPVYLNENEFQILISLVNEDDFRDFLVVAVLTGLRLGELINLRWTDINFGQRTLLVQNSEQFTTKTGRSRVLPIGEELRTMFLALRERTSTNDTFIFVDRRGRQLKEKTVSHKFKRFIRKAGLNDKLHFHSLRHTFASALIANGASLYQVQKLLGHTTSRTTEIYAHLLPQHLSKEMNDLEAKFSLRKHQDTLSK